MRLSTVVGVCAALISTAASGAEGPPDTKVAGRQAYQQVNQAWQQMWNCKRDSRAVGLAVVASQEHVQEMASAQFGAAERAALKPCPSRPHCLAMARKISAPNC